MHGDGVGDDCHHPGDEDHQELAAADIEVCINIALLKILNSSGLGSFVFQPS